MKTAYCAPLLLGAVLSRAGAAVVAPGPGPGQPPPIVQPRPAAPPLVLSKDASGPITRSNLSLALQSNAATDATATLIPNGSRFVSDNFQMQVNDQGIGTFAGSAQILNPNGQIIIAGQLRGVAGLTAHRAAGGASRAAGHLEGTFTDLPIFQPLPLGAATGTGATIGAGTSGSGMAGPGIITVPPPGPVPGPIPPPFPAAAFTISFSADINALSASPLPLYHAHLDGLVVPPPQPPDPRRVRIVPDRAQYGADDIVTAIVRNGSDQAIQVWDGQSYCSIVQLQRRDGGDWLEVAPCLLERPTMPVIIAPHATRRVRLPGTAGPEAHKEAGLYRLALSFTGVDDNGNAVGDPVTVTSPVFRVGPAVPPATVRVQPSASGYNTDQPITAIITNGLTVPVRVLDEQSLCTIVQLQQQTPNGWQLVQACPLDRAPMPTTINAGASLRVTLPTPAGTPANWTPGTYRLAITFSPVSAGGGVTPPERTVTSEPFRVGPPPPVVGSR